MEAQNVRGIFIKHYPPTGEDQKAAVICAHGFLSTHEELGTVLPERLARAGFHVYLYDHPGHGESEGARGYVHVPNLIRAFWEVKNYVEASLKEKYLKIFGLGHSLGSVPVLSQANHLSGIILVGPPSRLDHSITAMERFAYPIIYYGVGLPINFVAQMFGIHWELRIPYKFTKEMLFSEREYVNQAIVHLQTMAPVRNYPMIFTDNMAVAKSRTTPTLIFVGGKDRITGVAQSQELIDALAAQDKQLKILDRSGHSVFQDHDGPLLAEEAEKWLREHL